MSLDSVLFLIQKYQEGDLLTDYCKDIAGFLSERNVSSHLVCFGEEERGKKMGDLKLHTFSFEVHGDNYFSWSMLIQTEFLRKIRGVLEEEDISLLHANDWSTVPAGLVASKLFEVPLLITYHSVEEERGMDKPHSGHISELERQGIKEASYIIVHDPETKESMGVFDLPEGKVKFLDGGSWKENLYEIYQQVENVSSVEGELVKEGGKDENFNAYVGVPSA